MRSGVTSGGAPSAVTVPVRGRRAPAVSTPGRARDDVTSASVRVGAATASGGVLAVSASGVLGGAERVLLDWLGALDRPVSLACPPGALADAAADAGLTVEPLADRPLALRGRPVAALRDLAALRADITRVSRAHRPALVVASGQRPLLAAGGVPLGEARLLALLHDLPPGAAIGAALRASCRRADIIVATSGAIARAADPAGRRLDRTHVIHPGVDLARWADVPAPHGPPRALCLGALVPWKRADLALEIAARIPELRLDVAGAPLPGDPPGFVAALRERAAHPDLHDRVRLLGPVADPRAALAEAHLLLHCADAEPFGLVLVEALAAGRPVVAPAAGGPLEIVTPATGRLYTPGDADAGAAALRAVLAAPPPADGDPRAGRRVRPRRRRGALRGGRGHHVRRLVAAAAATRVGPRARA